LLPFSGKEVGSKDLVEDFLKALDLDLLEKRLMD